MTKETFSMYTKRFASRIDFTKMFSTFKVGTDVNTGNDEEIPALILASRDGKTEIVKTLLDEGGQVNTIKDAEGNSALQIASKEGKINIVRLLLENGADVTAMR